VPANVKEQWVKRHAQAKSPVHDKRGQYCGGDIGNGGYINFIEIVLQLHTSDLLSECMKGHAR